MDWFSLLIVIGAVARVTRLITADQIAGRLRGAVIRRYGPDSARAYFIGCPWCVGLWISGAAVAAWWGVFAHMTGDVRTAIELGAVALAVSYAVGFLAGYDR